MEKSLIPIWKLKREAVRLKDQISAIPLLIYEPIYQKYYDKNFEKKIYTHYGNILLNNKIAIFLIYQPNGLAESVFLTIEHLIQSGFSPVIISNCPLKNLDIEKLRNRTSLFVVRENFGYDFGGYRDAIWLLRNQGIDIDVILFLNDSVWFPVFDQSNMLKEMLASDSIYLGAQVFGERSSTKSLNQFYGSYCFLVKKFMIENEIFINFWDSYHLSSSKEVVLRRGERRFSREMLMANFNSSAIFSNEIFAKTINNLNFEQTEQALRDLIVLNSDFFSRKLNLLETVRENDLWLSLSKKLIIDQSKSKNFIGSSPIVSLNTLGFPMIKKNNEELYKRARNSIIKAIDSGRIKGLNNVIEMELRTCSLAN